MVPFVSLPYELFLEASLVTVQYELFLVVPSILATISRSVIYYCAICAISGSVCCITWQYLFRVVPFVMVQYELFLAMLFVTV